MTSLAVTPDGKTLVSTGDDQTIRFWDLAKKEAGRVDKGRSGDVRRIGLSDDGKLYLFNSFGNLEIRAVSDGRPTSKAFTNPKGVFSQVAVFAPKSGLVLAGTSNDELELWRDGEGLGKLDWSVDIAAIPTSSERSTSLRTERSSSREVMTAR